MENLIGFQVILIQCMFDLTSPWHNVPGPSVHVDFRADPTMPWSLGPPLDPSHMGIEKGGKLVVYVPKAAIPSDGVCVCISVSGVNVAVSPILVSLNISHAPVVQS